VVVLLSVTAGGSLYGIPGAFLAVPVAAVAAVVIRYIGEQIDLLVPTPDASGVVDPLTPPPVPPAESLSDRE
jgi:hypothetical protein